MTGRDDDLEPFEDETDAVLGENVNEEEDEGEELFGDNMEKWVLFVSGLKLVDLQASEK